jgi:uncharacterized protein
MQRAPLRTVTEARPRPEGLAPAPPLDRWGPVQQLVVQPTPFCNIDCRYCYLANRDDRRRMRPETAVLALRRVLESGRADREVEVRWHAGEPLTMPQGFYREALAGMRSLVPAAVRLRQTLQTNGTLVNAGWCELFREEGIEVGLSIDGPAFLHDRNRRTRSGGPTHTDAVRAVALLRESGVPFSVIAVLTDVSLDFPEEIYEFFAELRPTRVGFNLEETEGVHHSATFDVPDAIARFRAFLRRFHALCRDGRVRSREFDEMRAAILFGRGDRGNRMVNPGCLLCVDWQGNVSGFSPELLGIENSAYDSFLFGNVAEHSLADMVQSRAFRAMAADIGAGVQACKATCRYFPLCGGGEPSNKLGETGSFRSTATLHCTANVKEVVEVVLRGVEEELAGVGTANDAGAPAI